MQEHSATHVIGCSMLHVRKVDREEFGVCDLHVLHISFASVSGMKLELVLLKFRYCFECRGLFEPDRMMWRLELLKVMHC